MRKEEAIKLIDEHKNKMINPVEMLSWTWLRVIVWKLDDDVWNAAVDSAKKTISN